jgi:hypothetical protein
MEGCEGHYDTRVCPFRFMVIDDPVQAMDPPRVDGLPRVLERATADRQVIVFTRDSRLAVQQLRLSAVILEGVPPAWLGCGGAAVLDPVAQALADAGGLAADRSASADVAALVVPGRAADRGGGRVHRGDLAATASQRARPRRGRSSRI